MACFDFLAPSPEDPFDPGVPIFFPYAITPDGDEVYGGIITGGVDVYTWPGLVYVSSPYATTGHVAIDPSGNVYHQQNTGGTTNTIYKNGSVLASISLAANAFGGGLAFADGWLWTVWSSDAGTDSGSLYRVNPTTGSVTAVHTVTGGSFDAIPYAATDDAIWYVGVAGLAGTVYRYDGSVASTSLTVGANLIPRPGGVMLARTTGGSPAWVDIAPDMSSGAASCDPTVVAGAAPGPPGPSFSNPARTDVAFADVLADIYRAALVPLTRFTHGKVGFRG